MSEQNTAANETNAPAAVTEDNKPKRTRTPRATGKSTFSVQDLAAARLKARGASKDRLTDECKVVRGILRSNFAFAQKNDPAIKKAKDAANDRKPWPTNMNKHTFAIVVEGKRAKQS